MREGIRPKIDLPLLLSVTRNVLLSLSVVIYTQTSPPAAELRYALTWAAVVLV